MCCRARTLLALCICLIQSVVAQDRRVAEPRLTVLRTMAHHQLTAGDTKIHWQVAPIISDAGNRALFCTMDAQQRPIGVSVVDTDGRNLRQLDTLEALSGFDLSGDGRLVIYHSGTELRIADAQGGAPRSLLVLREAAIFSPRISTDGSRVYLMLTGGNAVRNVGGEKWEKIADGVVCIDVNSGAVRTIVTRQSVSAAVGAKPEEVSINFRSEAPECCLDVSANGRRVVFAVWVKDRSYLWKWEEGGSVGTLMSGSQGPTSYYTSMVQSVSLTADGHAVAYRLDNPKEIGVIRFDGTSRAVLMDEQREPRFPWMDHRLFITADGARVLHCGRLFTVNGGEQMQLIHSAGMGAIQYREYETPAMDASGWRFVYWPTADVSQPLQMALMELNPPMEQLRGAPVIRKITMSPARIPRARPDAGVQVYPKVEMEVQCATPIVGRCTGNTFLRGLWDLNVNCINLRDDGSARFDGDRNSEDRIAGDGIYTSASLYAQPNTELGPRTLRLDAQTNTSDGMRRGLVVELGYPEATEMWTEDSTSLTTDVVSPPRPPVNPDPDGPITTNNGNSGTNTNNNTGNNTGNNETIDLTGFWIDDRGAVYLVRQMGTRVVWSMDARPRVVNVFSGAIDARTLSGQWTDLPGGQLDNGVGNIRLRIESNNRMVKIEQDIGYDATVWTRTGAPRPPEPPVNPPVNPPAAGPWDTPEGQAAFEAWIAEAMRRVNAYKGSENYNAVKPYSINKYGILEHRKLQSVAAPDNFRDYGYNKYRYMWDYWVRGADGWKWPEWNAAQVPDIREYVNGRLSGRQVR